MNVNLIDYVKGQKLEQMYESVERMNNFCISGDNINVKKERKLQVELRKTFNKLQAQQRNK